MTGFNQELRKNMEYVCKVFEDMGIHAAPVESTSVLFLKLPEDVPQLQNEIGTRAGNLLQTAQRRRKTLTELMQELDIGFVPGSEYYEPVTYKGMDDAQMQRQEAELLQRSTYIRVNLGCPFPLLREKYDALRRAWKQQEESPAEKLAC